MSDLIDRQAAIDAFMTSTSDGDKADWCEWVLKQLPSAQQWIPCEERLPEPYAHVILTIRGTDMIKVEEGETLEQALERSMQHYWVTDGYLADDGWNDGDGFPLIVKPIAWMEFPEPWKGEEDA